MSVKIREFKIDDKNFLLDSWLKGYFKNQTGYKEDGKVFFSNHQRCIERLFNENKLIIQIACLPDDDDIILGYAVFGTDYSLHYISVKQNFQRLGIAKLLLKAFYKDRSEITVSHWTKDIQFIKRVYKVNYNRYRFFQ